MWNYIYPKNGTQERCENKKKWWASSDKKFKHFVINHTSSLHDLSQILLQSLILQRNSHYPFTLLLLSINFLLWQKWYMYLVQQLIFTLYKLKEIKTFLYLKFYSSVKTTVKTFFRIFFHVIVHVILKSDKFIIGSFLLHICKKWWLWLLFMVAKALLFSLILAMGIWKC